MISTVQETRLTHEYGTAAFKLDSRFSDMISDLDDARNVCYVDQSRLDAIEPTLKVTASVSKLL